MVAGVQHGFFRSAGGVYTTIDDPLGAGGTQALGINNAGQIVGTYSDSSGKSHGFLYNPNANTYSTLDDPLGAQGTLAFDINNAGQIVGFYTDSSSKRHGFLYNLNGGTFITLDDPLATGGTDPSGINDAGQVVGFYVDNTGRHGFLEITAPNPPPPGGTTADMILRHGADGFYEIYDIGNNSLLAAYQLGQVGTDWRFVTLGGFFGSDTTDMLLRNANGMPQVYRFILQAVKGDKATAHAIFEDYLAGKLDGLLSISRRCVSADQAGSSSREIEEGLGRIETIKSGRRSGVGDDALTTALS